MCVARDRVQRGIRAWDPASPCSLLGAQTLCSNLAELLVGSLVRGLCPSFTVFLLTLGRV